MAVGPQATGHAFISYVHEDSEQVDALHEVLDAAGIEVWRDSDQLWPGDEWKIQIQRAIRRNSLAFIACFSKQSAAKVRTFQNEELTLAVEEYRLRQPGRPWLFPVRFDDVEFPLYDLGAGKTLDSLQRTDLFGGDRAPQFARLAASVARVINGLSERQKGNPGNSEDSRRSPYRTNSTEGQANANYIKKLLRDPAKDIELDDLVNETADTARRDCLDTAKFPSSATDMNSSVRVGRLVIERVDQYWEIVEPLAEILAVGCAWGGEDQTSLWSRAIRTIANTTPPESGQTVLIELRAFPRLAVMYAGCVGALARENYKAFRAVAIDAKYRHQGKVYPVAAFCNPMAAFSAPSLAEVVALHADKKPMTDKDLNAILGGGRQYRKTPASDALNSLLRHTMMPILRDDEEYHEAFDKAEVLLGLVNQDVANQEADRGDYTIRPFVGRYAWRTRSSQGAFADTYDEFRNTGTSWPPLTAGLFARSEERAAMAFSKIAPAVEHGCSLFA